MDRNFIQSGHVYLELIILMVLSSGVYLFYQASEASTALIRNEDQACVVLDAIAEAQQEYHLATQGSESQRFGTLDELMAQSGHATDYFDVASELRRHLETSDRHGAVYANEAYCFAIYLCDAEGFEIVKSTVADNVQADFWIAYAWPREYGRNGRRVFALDSFGVLRSWNNQTNGSYAYSGPENLPKAHLAPAPDGHAYPFVRKPQGTQRVNKWQLE